MFEHLSNDDLVTECIAEWEALGDELEAILSEARMRTLVSRVKVYTDAPAGPRLRRLVCAECGRVDDGGHGWTLRLDVDDELVPFCPECEHKEFGDA